MMHAYALDMYTISNYSDNVKALYLDYGNVAQF